MSTSIYTNVSSLLVQRHLQTTQGRLAQSFERLSSGLRINSAKDDAAGLAIAERMNAKRRSLDQARRNMGEGASLAHTAESGLGEISQILVRLRELAVQAANDSNSSADRQQLHSEAMQLVGAFDQLARSAEYNGRKILDGSASTLKFQSGIENSSNDSIQVDLKGHTASHLGALAKEQGTFDQWGMFDPPAQFRALSGNGDLKINGVTIGSTAGYGAELGHVGVTNEQSGSPLAKAKAINAANAGVKAIAVGYKTLGFTWASTSVNYSLTINSVVIFSATQTSSLDDMVQRVNAKSDQTGVVATKNGTQFFLESVDGRNVNYQASTPLQGFPNPGSPEEGRGSIILVSDKTITITGNGANTGASLIGYNMGGPSGQPNYTILADSVGLNTGVNLTTRTTALDSLDRIDSAISKVLNSRSQMGALLNRFESTESYLSSASENLSSAHARIRDADFATETAHLTRNQLLQSAAASILAQANIAPSFALRLLS